jgi:hypothetical protein
MNITCYLKSYFPWRVTALALALTGLAGVTDGQAGSGAGNTVRINKFTLEAPASLYVNYEGHNPQ